MRIVRAFPLALACALPGTLASAQSPEVPEGTLPDVDPFAPASEGVPEATALTTPEAPEPPPEPAHVHDHGATAEPVAEPMAADGHDAHGGEGECAMDGDGDGDGDGCCACCSDGECDCCAHAPAVEVYLGLSTISRHFRYHQDVYGALRDYTLPAGPSISIGGRWFPGAHFTDGIGSAFGVGFRFDRSMGLDSERGPALSYPTAQRIFELDALGRFVAPSYEIVAGLGFGSHAFVLDNATPATPDLDPVPDIPDIDYRYVRVAVDGRFDVVRRFDVGFGVGALAVLDAGGIDDTVWFPRSQAGGLTLELDGYVPLAHGIELRASLEYRRYFHAMNSQLGDSRIAGGALDQYTTAELAVLYRR